MPDPDYHRNIEIEEAETSRLQAPRRGLSRFGFALVLAIGAGIVCSLIYVVWSNRPVALDSKDTTTDEELLPPSNQHVQLAPAPPPSPPPVVKAPPAPPPPQTLGRGVDPEAAAAEQRRLAEEQARRAEAERLAREAEEDARKWSHYRSPMVVKEIGPTTDAAAVPGVVDGKKKPEDNAKSPGTFQNSNMNDQFLALMTDSAVTVSKAEQTPRVDALIAQGTILHGVLETAVISDLPGMVRATTIESVWSFDGRRVLIPPGSHLIGQYNSGVTQGQTRVFIVWSRLLRADGVSVSLGSIGTDDLGRAGTGGDVDNHYLERYGTAVLLSVISASGQVFSQANSNRNNTGPIVSTVVDPTTGVATSTTSYSSGAMAQGAAANGAGAFGQGLSQFGQEALKSSLNIPPTIAIDQGTRVAIFVRRDLDFSALYPDPVREKLDELKQGRRHGGR
jgi:type IV secretion system protein VirB10